MKRTLTGIVVSLLGVPPVAAQSFPVKPVRLVSAFPPGGGGDAVARLIAQPLAEQLGQQVVVETRAGASGLIGTAAVAKSAPDGYTMILGSVAPIAILPAATPNMVYDPLKDLQPISLLATSDYVLTVHPSLPARSVKELIALANTNPGKLTYASSGTLGGPHLAGELLSMRARVKLVHVPYKGNGPAGIGVMSGESTMMFGSGPAVVPHIGTGRLRGIATTGSKRSIPELATVAESLPGYEVKQWYGLLFPAGVPRDILDRMHQETVRAIANPKVAQTFVNVGTQPESSTVEEFRSFIRSELDKWTKVIRAGNIRAD